MWVEMWITLCDLDRRKRGMDAVKREDFVSQLVPNARDWSR